MKRSYDYSFATDGRDYTYATTTHSFTLRHPYARATQAAPSYTYSVQACSTNIASGSSSGTGLPFVDFRRPLLSATSGSHDDFQSNAATPNAAVPQEADGYFAFRPEPGSTGLGIQCDGLAAQHARPTVKHEEFTLDSLGQLCSPLPGGLLEMLTEPYAAPTGGNEFGPSCTQTAKDVLLTREDAQDDVITLEDSLGFFPGSATPSLLYPSSPALGTGAFWGDVPLFYSSGSESSVEDTLVNTSLFYPSSAEVSATSSPVKAALFLSSSSLASVQDSHAASSGCVRDPLRALLDFDSPLLGLGQDVFVKQQEAVVGLYADVNLRRIPTAHDAPEVYINPAELTSGHGLAVKTEEEQDVAELSGRPDVVAPEQDKLPTTDSGAITGFTDEAVQAIVGVITGANHGEYKPPSSSLPEPREALACLFPPPGIPPPIIPQPTNFPFAPSTLAPPVTAPPPKPALPQESIQPAQYGFASLNYAPYAFFPSSLTALQQPQVHRTPLLDCQPPAPVPVQQTQAHASPILFDTHNAGACVTHPQSPICNAHMGVELEELRQRAEKYRQHNFGVDIDKVWLQAFAGRLSEDGVLIDEWRCYVKGCSQRNKRRDHILVHVGSHVEHRPFCCGRCGMRFLRKNECKRHEASHDGTKPFECSICAPVQHRSFARQDLLKRHMRVTHGVTGGSERRKRMKMDVDDGDGEYHP